MSNRLNETISDSIKIDIVDEIIDYLQEYENSDVMWNDAKSVGQFVIEKIQEFTELNFKEEE